MLLNNRFSKIVTKTPLNTNRFFLLIVGRQKSHGTECQPPNKLSAKLQDSLNAIRFLAVVLLNLNMKRTLAV